MLNNVISFSKQDPRGDVFFSAGSFDVTQRFVITENNNVCKRGCVARWPIKWSINNRAEQQQRFYVNTARDAVGNFLIRSQTCATSHTSEGWAEHLRLCREELIIEPDTCNLLSDRLQVLHLSPSLASDTLWPCRQKHILIEAPQTFPKVPIRA